jgi:superfamily II DNA or RNA helicase
MSPIPCDSPHVPSSVVGADSPEIAPKRRYSGIVAGVDVEVVAVDHHGSSLTVTYETPTGGLGRVVLTAADLATVEEVTTRRWTFDGDGAMFRLASEARRMKWAHLADPFAAVDTSNIEPYPHQIDAVYNRFLTVSPLKFVLADDPGAGKTIMAGLLIRELMLRGDVARCLIVAPGSLVEQWQDELWEKFGLRFDLMSRAKVEESLSGNPFLERNLLIARVDQLSRADDLRAKLEQSDWDLIICDEAHKMSARLYGNELKKTRRFELGETLRDHTRHLLLLTATPHNGKNEDFLAFMTLIDPARFAGRLRDTELPEVDDVMRRLVKEKLVTFEGTPLFPKRFAHTVKFELSDLETRLYEEVTEYVQHGMNRADQMTESGDKRRGLIVGFALAGLQRRLASSPDAIYHSLRRRHDRLTKQLAELRRGKNTATGPALPAGVRVSDLEDFDYDDFDDEELEQLEDAAISVAADLDPQLIAAELVELEHLVKLADEVRNSGLDTKWVELRNLLRSDEFKNIDDANGRPRKLIVFSEHKDTLDYVASKIRNELGNPEAVVTIHGGMKREDRREVQERFRVDPIVRVLVATDAAGEGVNLQVANLMVNYDLPWNPNRIEQRFGRIHRIGQKLPCHLWNLVAHETREGKVWERLLAKIEEQRGVFGDQVYDVLGDSVISTTLQELLIRAIRADDEAVLTRYMEQVIEHDIGSQLKGVLEERALIADLGQGAPTDTIRDLMESAKARKLQPWFVEAFFTAALELYGGRIVGREPGRYEITRVPAAIRAHAAPGSPVHERYSRVTFDKRAIQPDKLERAELISPGTALLNAVVDKVLADHGSVLSRGATLVDPLDPGTEPRLLVYLDHTITNGKHIDGQRQVVSRRFQYVEIDRHGNVTNRGGEPYVDYAALTDTQRSLLDAAGLDDSWANHAAEAAAKSWAIDNLAGPHFEEIAAVTKQRVAKVREAVRERLTAEIRYWDRRTEEIKAQELAGKKPQLNSGRARARADELEARLTRRRLELDLEENLHNNPPTVVAAALVIPQGLLDSLAAPRPAPTAPPVAPDTEESDRRAIAAVVAAELALGRIPTVQAHNNPGYDIESVDPETGIHYFIEVKGHKPTTETISVSATQVQKAKSNPERWRLAVVEVPDDPDAELRPRYLVDPFSDVRLHFAQTSVPLDVAALLADGKDPL